MKSIRIYKWSESRETYKYFGDTSPEDAPKLKERYEEKGYEVNEDVDGDLIIE